MGPYQHSVFSPCSSCYDFTMRWVTHVSRYRLLASQDVSMCWLLSTGLVGNVDDYLKDNPLVSASLDRIMDGTGLV